VNPILLALLLTQAPQARVFVLDPAQSHVTFHLDHALHKVDGQAKQLEAKAQLAPDGGLKTMARAQVASLDTGDGNRDANLRAVMEADQYPYVVLKGTGQLARPTSFPAILPLTLDAEVDVHGVKRPMKVPLQVSFTDANTARIRGAFDVSLTAHHVERPSLLFKKVDDATKVTIDLLLRAEGR
jgi:polyisoprenoid-binding protein YceI